MEALRQDPLTMHPSAGRELCQDQLRMIRKALLEIGVKERFARRVLTGPARFNSDKDGVDLHQDSRVVGFEDPAAIGFIAWVEDPQADRPLAIGIAVPPGLKHTGSPGPRLQGKIADIEDQ